MSNLVEPAAVSSRKRRERWCLAVCEPVVLMWKRLERGIRESLFPLPATVGAAVVAVLRWVGVARADIDFTKITTEVETMKSDFLALLKVVMAIAAVVIVVKGMGVVSKKLATNDPHATWHLVGVGAAAAVLLIAIAII
jgi:hypothetical protein